MHSVPILFIPGLYKTANTMVIIWNCLGSIIYQTLCIKTYELVFNSIIELMDAAGCKKQYNSLLNQYKKQFIHKSILNSEQINTYFFNVKISILVYLINQSVYSFKLLLINIVLLTKN